MRADAPVFIPGQFTSSTSTSTSGHPPCTTTTNNPDNPTSQHQRRSNSSRKRKVRRRRRKGPSNRTVNGSVDHQGSENVKGENVDADAQVDVGPDGSEQPQLQLQGRETEKKIHKRNNHRNTGRGRSNDNGHGTDQRKSGASSNNRTSNKVKDKRSSRRRKGRGKNSNNNNNNNMQINFQQENDDKDDNDDSDDDVVRVNNLIVFPSLGPKKESNCRLYLDEKDREICYGPGTAANEGVTVATKNTDDKIQEWCNVANTGHKNSVERQLELQRRREKLQYELDTYTRMEVLHGGRGGYDVDDDIQNDDLQTQSGDETEKVSSVPYHNKFVGWTINKLLRADKLKERWLRALQEKQQKDEEERQRQKRQILLLQNNNNIVDQKEHSSYFTVNENDNVNNNMSSSSNSYSSESTDDSSSDSDSDSSISSDSYYLSLNEYLRKPYPLHYSIAKNDEAAVRDLLSLQPNLTSRDKHVQIKLLQEMLVDEISMLPPMSEEISLSILHFATLINRPNIVKVLLSSGRKYNLDYVTSALAIDDTKNDLKCTVLMMACEFDFDACIKVLMSYGPKMNIRHPHSGDCALHVACRHAQSSTVKLLLSSSKGSSTVHQRLIYKRNRRGETPLHLCCSLGRIDIVEVLLKVCSGPSTSKALIIEDEQFQTPIMSAIVSGASNIVLLLLSWRSNLKASQLLPKKCIILAVRSKSIDMVSMLVECLDPATCPYNFSDALCEALRLYDDTSEEGMEIIKVLVQAGTNIFTPCSEFVQNNGGETVACNSPLSIACVNGKFRFVASMLDIFFALLKKNQKKRRMDRVLMKRPIEYFTAKEKIEHEQCLKSGQDAMLSTLLSCTGCTVTNNSCHLGCCLAILRRGIPIDRSLLQAMKTRCESKHNAHLEIVLDNKNLKYQGGYDHILPKYSATKSQVMHNSYSRSYADYWSKVLLSMNWVWKDVAYGECSCPWIQSEKRLRSDTVPAEDEGDDECYLLVGETPEPTKFLAHKSILSSKSSKLEAAIRFAEMNNKNKNTFERTEILLDISIDMMKLFIQHCYHGSITVGLSPNKAICCQQLIDLFVLSQEYICPSLSLECEMRLLSCDPYRCICWKCCDEIDLDFDKQTLHTKYNMKGPSLLLTSENLMSVIVQLEELNELESCYEIIVKSETFTQATCKPLEILRLTTWISTILSFTEVLKSDSYISILHSTMHEYREQSSEQLECFGDEIAALLLQTCYDAVFTER